MSANSEDYLFVCTLYVYDDAICSETARRASRSLQPNGYEYDVYNLCLSATTKTVPLCALGHDDYVISKRVWQ